MNEKLEDLRASVSRLMVAWLWLNAGLAGVTGYVARAGWVTPLLLGALLAAAAHAAWALAPRSKSSRLTIAVAFVALVSVMVAAARGSVMQIDLHMYYFAALAMLAAYCDRDVVVLGAAVVAVHHLSLNYLAPTLVFPDGADLSRVLLHAVILVAEAMALVWMADAVVRLFREAGRHLDQAMAATRQAEMAQRDAQTERAAREAEQAAAMRAKEQGAKRLQRVVNALAAALSRLADGVLNQSLNESFGAEYDVLREDFNAAVRQLRDAIRILLSSAGAVQNGAAEISGAVEDLARRTEHQAASLEETSAALGEVTAALRSTVDDMTRARDVVGAARHITETSGAVVREVVEAMDRINGSSQQIARIIGVINDIAFQTNLLALNAGVEAARAGDAGRGFAVVATEVRALAQRTADAAKEIRGLIATSETQVRAGVDCVGRTGEVLSKLAAQVEEIDSVVRAVSDTARQQSASLTQVNDTVAEMDRVTQHNAAMVEQTSAAATSLLAEAEQMMTLGRRFEVEGTAIRATASPHRPARAPELEGA